MRQFKVPGKQPQAAPVGLTRGEKWKLVFMGGGLILVLMAFGTALIQSKNYRSAGADDLPELDGPMTETVHVPEIETEALAALVHDTEAADRVILESEALDLLMNEVRTLTPRHFEAMNAEELDATKVAALVENPDAFRGRPFFARGRIDSARSRHRGDTNQRETIGRIVLEDGSPVYFVALDAPQATLDTGGFVRIDGLFLKVYSDENAVEPGDWIEGPLLFGPKAIRSYRDLGIVEEPHLGLYFEAVDANLVPDEAAGEEFLKITDSPFEPLWHLMAWARDQSDDAVDWSSVPELDNAALIELLENPEDHRASPYRIPISRIQDARVLRAGENPARIEHYTQGWIGNTTWEDVVHFKYPHADYEVKLRDYAYGRGFFLHNFAYESSAKGLRTAPVFVLQELVRFVPEPDPFFAMLGYSVAGVAVLLAGLFFVLLVRDRRKARALKDEMARRRQARQSRQQSMGTAST